jgi:hypothetical protein
MRSHENILAGTSTIARRVRALVVLASSAVVFTACGSDRSTSPAPADLDGPWSAHQLGVGLVLDLTWSRDSVHGTGTYDAVDNTLGCGGSTLTDAGTVTLAAAWRADGTVQGTMKFDNGWSPPYTGTLVDDSRIEGAFGSIDAGPCPLTLFRGLVP